MPSADRPLLPLSIQANAAGLSPQVRAQLDVYSTAEVDAAVAAVSGVADGVGVATIEGLSGTVDLSGAGSIAISTDGQTIIISGSSITPTTTFDALTDTPSSKTGNDGAVVVVSGGNLAYTDRFIFDNTLTTQAIVPDASGVYDIGTSGAPFRTGYFTSSSLYLGTTKLSVDGSGNLLVDGVEVGSGGAGGIGSISGDPIAAMVMKSTDQTGIVGSGTITFDTTIYDNDGMFDNVNDYFVAPQNGYYLFTAHAQFNNQSTADDIYIAPNITSSLTQPADIRWGRDNPNISFPGIQGSIVLRLNAGDTISLDVVGDASFDVRSAGTYMTLTLISAPGELNDLNNVSGTPTDGQVLTYSDAASGWQPSTISTSTAFLSASEMDTGNTWVNGKTIYRKIIATGSLPNTGQSDVPHGITGLDDLLNIEGYCDNGATRLSLPFVSTSTASVISVYIPSSLTTHVRIDVSSADRSGYSGFLILEYTKT